MAVLTITVEVGGGGPRPIAIDPEGLTLGFLEDLERAQETGKWRDMIPAIQGMLGLERAEARAITLRQWKQIGAALKEAADSPNASG